MSNRLPNLLCLVLLAALTGCTTYAHNVGGLRTNLMRGDYEGARQSLSDAKGSDRLLFLLENGLIAHNQGQYVRSNTCFEEAERLAEERFTRSLSREVAALVTNDAVRPYRGEEFERAFIHYYRALNYWYLGLPEDALVECRKANLRLAGYAAAAEYDATYKNDAFLHYMTGLFYEATGELNDAYISYQDAARAYQTYAEAFGLQPPASLEEDLHRVSQALGYTDGAESKPVSLSPQAPHIPDGDGELILFSEIGFVPYKAQEEIDLPLFEDDIRKGREGEVRAVSKQVAWRYRTRHRAQKVKYWLRVALPVYRETPPGARTIRLSASGQTGSAVPAEDLSAIARVTFQDKQPVILARTVARAFAKYLATEGAKKESKILGFFANLLAASTEVADTRGWVSLPHTIQIGRLRLPAGAHDITVEILDGRERIIEQKTFPAVQIRGGERTFLSFRTYR